MDAEHAIRGGRGLTNDDTLPSFIWIDGWTGLVL